MAACPENPGGAVLIAWPAGGRTVEGVISVLGFDQIRDQQQPIRLLTAFIRRNRLPHALIFTGVDGVGKRSAAMALALSLNCEALQGPQPSPADSLSIACRDCRPCRWIMAGNHPDVIRIDPVGKLIRIDQIRRLLDSLSKKPYGRGRRIVLIAEAHGMNPEAGNALLKMLEEPPANTILILTTHQTSDLLPTIVSRCQRIRFRPLPPDTIRSLLMTQEGLERQEADVVARMAGGSYTRAVRLFHQGWIARRNWIIREITTPQAAVSRLALAEQLARLKDHLPDALECILSYYRDVLVWRYHPRQITNRDLQPEIEQAAASSRARELIDRIRATQEALRYLNANANPRLTMETLILQLDAA
jgi:DNA polymerase-3 subunit delta'